ncbi:MAG: oligosaccharide flippase family protein [Thermodesulfobacteriota bacterium]
MLCEWRDTLVEKVIKDNFVKRIVKNSGIVFFGNSMASAMSIVAFALMARSIGPEYLAVLVLAQTYSLVINDIFNVQTWESMVKFGSSKKGSSGVSSVVRTNLMLDVVSAVVAFVFALVLLSPVSTLLGWNDEYLFVIQFYCVTILFNITTITIGVPRLYNKFFSIARIQVFVNVVKLVAVVVAVSMGYDVITYFAIYLFSDVALNLLLILYGRRILSDNLGPYWWKENFKVDKEQLRFIWWTNLRTITRIPVRHLDMIIISSVLSMKMVGVYKVYKEVAGFIGRFADPINQAIYPEMTKMLGGDDRGKTAAVAVKTISLLALASVFLVIVLCILAKSVIISFFGPEYVGDILVLYVLIVLFGVKLITSPINPLFIASGFARYSFLIVLFTNSVYLITAIYFGNLWGLMGLVVAFALQWFLNKASKVYFLKKYHGEWGELAL